VTSGGNRGIAVIALEQYQESPRSLVVTQSEGDLVNDSSMQNCINPQFSPIIEHRQGFTCISHDFSSEAFERDNHTDWDIPEPQY